MGVEECIRKIFECERPRKKKKNSQHPQVFWSGCEFFVKPVAIEGQVTACQKNSKIEILVDLCGLAK